MVARWSASAALSLAGLAVAVSVLAAPSSVAHPSATSAAGLLKEDVEALTSAPIPVVRGEGRPGGTLTAKTGAWTPRPVALTYQWRRDGVPIVGAKARLYVVTEADKDTSLTVTVTGRKNGFRTTSKTSAGTTVLSEPQQARQPNGTTAEDVAIGVILPSYHYDLGTLDYWEGAARAHADVLTTFISWEYTEDENLNRFPYWRAREIYARGTSLEVTWVPQNSELGTSQPDFSLKSIVAGAHDAYIRQFAEDVKRLGSSVRIRFAHEMNGVWQSYNEANSGNESGDFVAAWRHVVDQFEDVGASNVTWVWAPNVLYSGSAETLQSLYPGDAYVDLVGVDGYSRPEIGCPTPSGLFDPTLEDIRSFADAPIVIAEVGVSDRCDDQARWVATFFDWIEDRGISGFTWWEREAGQDDYRLTTGADLRHALRAGLNQVE